MKPLLKILHPTDFSACATAALDRALDLRQRYGGSLTLFHAYQMPVDYSNGFAFALDVVKVIEDAARVEMAKVKDRATRFAKELAGQQPIPDIETRVIMGSAYQEVVREAKQGHYDLVVMGTHGRTGLKHLVMGSVAERVVRMVDCPVLTVHGEGADEIATP